MLALRIALRYLFSPKSHNVINAITVVAAVGVMVISAALVCTLSVYNGFESLVDQLCSQFDPDLRIEPERGKTFHATDAACGIDGATVSAVLEEDVIASYDGRQIAVRLKGVDSTFWCGIDSQQLMLSGTVPNASDDAIVGLGVAVALGINTGFVRPMTVYCPRRGGRVSVLRPEASLASGDLFCSGVFAVQQAEYDDNYIVCGIDFVRSLLDGDSTLTSAYEVRSASTQRPDSYAAPGFVVTTRRELHAEAYRIMRIEKWITYLIIIFILLVASFSVVGALSMLIIDKQPQTATLRALGADAGFVRRVFVIEGWLISGLGAAIGITVGLALCLAQQHYGLLRLADDTSMYVIDAYPVVVRWSDVLLTLFGVGIVGLMATFYPTLRLPNSSELR